MMKNFKRCILSLLFLTNYAKAQEYKIFANINVLPDSSLVFINDKFIGTTPLQIKHKLDFNEYLKQKLKIVRNGYHDTIVWIDEAYASNFPQELKFDLTKKRKPINPDDQKLVLQFEKLLIEFNNGQQIGEATLGNRKEPIRWDQSGVSGGTVEFNNIADKELKDFGYRIYTASKLFSDDQNVEPKLILAGTLSSISYNTSLHFLESKGSCKMAIEWQLYSRVKNKVVFKYNTEGYFYKRNSNSETIIKECFRDAMDNLLNSDTFSQVVIKQEHFGNESSPKNSQVVSIKRIQPQKFNSRVDLVQALIKSCVTVKCDNGFGSGFFVTNDGLIITNSHVVNQSKTISVVMENGIDMPAELIYEDQDFDLAIIRVKGRGFKPVSMGNSDDARVGIEVTAIGTPRLEELNQTVTKGILSGKRIFDGRSFLQTDATINGGNSGGPLFNEAGEVIGINTYKIRGAEGLNLSIPINVAIDRLNIKFE